MNKLKDKVAIVGSAPGSCKLAPYKDDTWEIWGLNFGLDWMPRIDVLFELHDPVALQLNQQKHWQNLITKDHNKKIVMQRAIPEIKGSIEYPLGEIIKEFESKYFTNSVSYMIALACYMGYKEIGLWGVDMAQSHQKDERNEYSWQRPSCEFWCGVAVGRGIKFTVSESSDLLKCRVMYGYQLSTGDMINRYNARRQELIQRIEDLDIGINKLQQQANQQLIELQHKKAVLQGALDEVQYGTQWIPEGQGNFQEPIEVK